MPGLDEGRWVIDGCVMVCRCGGLIKQIKKNGIYGKFEKARKSRGEPVAARRIREEEQWKKNSAREDSQ